MQNKKSRSKPSDVTSSQMSTIRFYSLLDGAVELNCLLEGLSCNCRCFTLRAALVTAY